MKIQTTTTYLESEQIEGLLKILDDPEKYKYCMEGLRAARNGLSSVMESNKQHTNPIMWQMFTALNELYGVLLFNDMSKNIHLR